MGGSFAIKLPTAIIKRLVKKLPLNLEVYEGKAHSRRRPLEGLWEDPLGLGDFYLDSCMPTQENIAHQSGTLVLTQY